MPKTPVMVRLPQELIDAVDVARGDVNRTLYVQRALEAALNGEVAAGGRPAEVAPGATASPRASADVAEATAEMAVQRMAASRGEGVKVERYGPRRPRVGARPRGKR